MEQLDIRELIKAGFHFGHRTSRWDPRMKPYIFKRRNLIHIIDLRETLRGLIVARKIAEEVAAKGDYVLFVGTKKQAANLVEREARHCAMPYVAERWPGGLLTNYVTIRKRLDRLEELEELEETGQLQLYSKKMVSSLRREKRKILRNLGGVRNMDELPGLIVIVDPARENIAVREGIKLDIPLVGLTDTNGNPEELDVVVPGNDDSIAAIEIFLHQISEAVIRGLARRGVSPPVQPEPEPVEQPEETEPAEEAKPDEREAPEPEAEPSESVEAEETPEAPEEGDEEPEASDEEPEAEEQD